MPCWLWSQSPHTASVAKLKFQARADSAKAGSAAQSQFVMKFELADTTDVEAIVIRIQHNNNSSKKIERAIPFARRRGNRKGVAYLRRGKNVWIDFGMRSGSTNWTAYVATRDKKGNLSSIAQEPCVKK